MRRGESNEEFGSFGGHSKELSSCGVSIQAFTVKMLS